MYTLDLQNHELLVLTSRGLYLQVVVVIVSDGRKKVNSRTLSVLATQGVYQDGVAKNVVNGKPVTCHIYEYTTQIAVTPDLKYKGAEAGIVPVQIIFALKEQNQKKINSHRWFFNAFARCLNPNVCVLLDVGTRPGPTSIYHLWKAFDKNSNVGGAVSLLLPCSESSVGTRLKLASDFSAEKLSHSRANT